MLILVNELFWSTGKRKINRCDFNGRQTEERKIRNYFLTQNHEMDTTK